MAINTKPNIAFGVIFANNMACGNVWGLLVLGCIWAFPSARAVNCDGINSAAANEDYKDAFSKAILFFEGQRSGTLRASQRVKWRGDSALSDGKPDNVNLVGGYYDAGDNVKFG
ncbi:hypothetical protein RJ639_046836 [Escallonia herrerae]|uniref:cellulase n=1 Tax=Escallonia herrerae TaxID=1293975 RepID=A0AA89AWY6_9ASTE|nr:hypothetical protein RJ639_046836 [Escallonia herrerae]